ncbi:ABC transporter substrate-binding protein [Aggregatibacter kilianii]|uniref:ABC transporter substrate-binding protein n=1 Tax=Aggregatibacter kilianii TaxID=2025884 RepID=UPI000D652B13|nr:ABC transporter substrate-binding protein [Aggregatibacter kilianii]
MQRREFLKLTSALMLAGVLPKAFAENKAAFTVYGAPALPSLIIAIAALQGRLAKQMDVTLKLWRNPDQLRAGVSSGEFKVMMSPSNVGVNLRNQGQNVGMINILTTGITNFVSKKTLSEFGDLTGKKIIVPFKNDMPDIMLRALLQQFKIDQSKVDITYSAAPAEAVGLFLSKDYDVAFLAEPLTSACILKGKAMGVNVERSLNIQQLWAEAFNTKPLIPQAGIIANVDFYRENQLHFDTFQQDLTDALTWILANTAQAADIGTKYFPAPAPAIAEGLPFANLSVIKGSELKQEIMQFYDILMRFNPKLLGGKLPNESFFLC